MVNCFQMQLIFTFCFFVLLFQYIADNCLENNPWHVVDEWALKVNKFKAQNKRSDMSVGSSNSKGFLIIPMKLF